MGGPSYHAPLRLRFNLDALTRETRKGNHDTMLVSIARFVAPWALKAQPSVGKTIRRLAFVPTRPAVEATKVALGNLLQQVEVADVR